MATNTTTTAAAFFSFFFFFFFSLISGSLPTLPSSPTELAPSSSTISAAPSYSYLPDTPKFPAEPPALSPDVMPVFPSPRRGSGTGSADGMPTIPSSQSPPNPDLIEPDSALAPFGSSSAAMTTGDAPSEMKSWLGLASGAAIIMWLL